MNKKGFAISVVLYSIVFLLISVLYMIVGILKTRYHNENDLRDAIVEQLNESVDRIIICDRLTGTEGNLITGDTFKCDVNGDGIYSEETEKFYYISNYYNQINKKFDPSIAVLIHSLNSYDGNSVSTNSPVQWNTILTVNSGPSNINASYASSKWLNTNLKNNPRSIMVGYGTSASEYTTFRYTRAARLLSVEEYQNGCNPTSKCNFLFNTTVAEVGDGIWLENIASPSSGTVYVLKASNHELSTAAVTSNNMARAVIEVPKNSINY